jgi:hypothetical protein
VSFLIVFWNCLGCDCVGCLSMTAKTHFVLISIAVRNGFESSQA